ncbi:MAG: zeta toxin [Bacteroidales bacterium]|nr:zeta toxin [Bacteroidales bacterium]
MPNLYIISGCNGSGKTTASFTVLPETLACLEFLNADEIARGLSPLNPDKAAIEAGRMIIKRIDKLLPSKVDFAVETTLSTKVYAKTVEKAKEFGYKTTLIFFWLDSVDLAIERVKLRVVEGGHNVPQTTITRRYYSGIKNLFHLYMPICDYWMIFDNSKTQSELIAEGYKNKTIDIKNTITYETIKKLA